MSTKVKVKIEDNTELRSRLDELYNSKTQIELAQWALRLAKHILELIGVTDIHCDAIQNGFKVNEAWQRGEARMHDVRQAGFQIHRFAKECNDPIIQAALRVAGQAVGTGHMREHAMVASDYAIKTINLKYPKDTVAIIRERQWQIQSLDL